MTNFKMVCSLLYQLIKVKCFTKRAPVFVSLVLNERCNLRCKYCYANIGNRFDDNIGGDGFTKQEVFSIVDELYSMGTRLIYLLGGEPLLREDIGEIVNYIVSKGIFLHLITNGTLIKRKFNEIKAAHMVCVSLDGPEKFNDMYRGSGTYHVVLENIKFALENKLPVRIHPVLRKNSVKILPEFTRLCKELGVFLTYSPPNYLGETSFEDFRLTGEEYKEVYSRLIKLKRQGALIGNSMYALQKVLDWPISYHSFITREQAKSLKYKPIFCTSGYMYAAIDSSGIMFDCINLGIKNGLNIREVGIKKAWEYLFEIRKETKCASCTALSFIELSATLNLSPQILWNSLVYYLKVDSASKNEIFKK